ncbi:MAG: hypothetical protein HC831_08070 [Chloroflexia bacterium]|nr:hypothetical protein [Chloroflexia bacterium]
MQFKRGKDVRKALNIGMNNVWPDILDELKKLLSDHTWDVYGSVDELDDEFYINIHRKNPIRRGVIKSFEMVINCDTKAIWVQAEARGPNYGKVLEKDHWNATSMEKLDDSGNSNREIAESIERQAKKLWQDHCNQFG